jgi:hypothetical protein
MGLWEILEGEGECRMLSLRWHSASSCRFSMSSQWFGEASADFRQSDDHW